MAILKRVVSRNALSMLYGVFEKNLHLYTVTREKKDKKDNTGKRRRNLQGLKFDPSINLKKNKKMKQTIDPKTDTPSNKANASAIAEVTPIQNKKMRTETEISNDFQEMIIQTLSSYFLAMPGSCISSVDEFNKVRTI